MYERDHFSATGYLQHHNFGILMMMMMMITSQGKWNKTA
jgi:hypothetical protein